jgi:hypothetical protein
MPLDAHDMRDDLAGFFDDDHIPFADVLAPDLVGIVQSGSADGGSGQLHWLEFCCGRDHTRLADADDDLLQPRTRLVLLPLVRHDPTRTLGRRSQSLALIEPVDLQDQSIDLEIQFVQMLHHVFAVCQCGLEGVEFLSQRRRRQAVFGDLPRNSECVLARIPSQ